MKILLIGLGVLTFSVSIASAQMTFRTIGEYCDAMSEVSTPTLLTRSKGLPKSEAEKTISFMTDPRSIRAAHEVLDYAYSRPAGMSMDAMRAELKMLCLDRKIFAQ